jgi:hypothetical protein
MHRIRARLSFANVISLIALFVALGGSSYAAITLQRNSVGAKQIKAGGVGSSEVKDGSLLRKDFKRGQLPAGATGPQGPQGSQGVQGPAGVVGRVVVRRTDVALPAGAGVGTPGTLTSAFATCAAGEKLIGGSVNVSDPANSEVRISRPATDDVGTGGIPTDGDTFTFWKGTARTTTNVAATARVFAICATA